MTPDEMRALDQRVGQALTTAARPLLPWLGALYVIAGTTALCWFTEQGAMITGCAAALASVIVVLVLVPYLRHAGERVNASPVGK